MAKKFISVERVDRPKREDKRRWTLPLFIGIAVAALLFVIIWSSYLGVFWG
jgi:hypothetical protein